MSALPSGYDMFSNGEYANAPYTTDMHMVGSHNIGLFRVVNNPAGHYPDPPISDYLLQIGTRGIAPASLDLGARAFKTVVRRGTTLLAPPETKADYQLGSAFSVDVVGLPQALLANAHIALGGDGKPDLEMLHSDAFTDEFIFTTVQRMLDEASGTDAGGALFVDYAANSIAAALLTHAGRVKIPDPGARALDDTQMGLITSILMDRLEERVPMDDLAEALGFDVFRFTRAFKAATGTTPHKYLIGLRISRIAERLANTDETIAEIAYSSGFSSQSHMTTAFSDHMGASPAAYRKEMRA